MIVLFSMALKILLHHIDLFYKLCYFLVLSNYGLTSVAKPGALT